MLTLLGERTEKLLSNSGLLIVEHHHKKELPEQIGNIQRQRVLKQGDSSLSFYEVVGGVAQT